MQNSNENIIATGSFSKYSSIAIRIFDFKETFIDKNWFLGKFKIATAKRHMLGYGDRTPTTGYRLIFGEADEIPGLIVDVFDKTLVIQISTAGILNFKNDIVEALKEVMRPNTIIEKSDMQVLKEEHLQENKQILYGDLSKKETNGTIFKENGINFFADIMEGQKTGFFLDQKDLRLKIKELAQDKVVADIFSYTGAAGIYALKGGAKNVTFVDASQRALEFCDKHAKKNFKTADINLIEDDAFNFISNAKQNSFDMVLLDPPALIKTQKSIESGKKAYHFLNRAGLRMVKDGGIFVTSSCSHFLSEEDFIFLLRRAEVQTNTTLHILAKINQSPDHPLSINFPESKYLKSFAFLVSKH